MKVFLEFLWHLLGLLFYAAQIGFLPGLIAYFIERDRLNRDRPRCRARGLALFSVLFFVVPLLSSNADFDTAFAVLIISFFAASILLCIAAGLKLAHLSTPLKL